MSWCPPVPAWAPPGCWSPVRDGDPEVLRVGFVGWIPCLCATQEERGDRRDALPPCSHPPAAFGGGGCLSWTRSHDALVLLGTGVRASCSPLLPVGMFRGSSPCRMNIHQAPALQPQDLIRKGERP